MTPGIQIMGKRLLSSLFPKFQRLFPPLPDIFQGSRSGKTNLPRLAGTKSNDRYPTILHPDSRLPVLHTRRYNLPSPEPYEKLRLPPAPCSGS